MSEGWSLEDALAHGRGNERPFRCFMHDDRHASASVNILKGLWHCFGCQASGAVDDKRVPTEAELLEMLEPEKAAREYPRSWLDLFGYGGYWLDRFPAWVCWHLGLGEDPFTGDATFPVQTPSGTLAGVGRRLTGDVEKGSRYRYPSGWSAAMTLWSGRLGYAPAEALVLTEGAADAASLREVGVPAYATYGAGLHDPQVKALGQMNPQLVLLGYDADDAGRKAAERDLDRLAEYEVAVVDWSEGGEKDPADLDPVGRVECLASSVRTAAYGGQSRLLSAWAVRARALQALYETREG